MFYWKKSCLFFSAKKKPFFHWISIQWFSMSFRTITAINKSKDIYLLWKNQKATFGQHLGNTCCLNIVFKGLLRPKISQKPTFYRSLMLYLGNTCCLNVALKINRKSHFCVFFDVTKPLRQHLGNICCLNVDQMLIINFFINRRYFLHQKSLKNIKNLLR